MTDWFLKKNFNIVYNTKNVVQMLSEVALLLDKLEVIKPKIVVEIGIAHCGNLACMSQVLPQSFFIGIDIGSSISHQFTIDNLKLIPHLKLLTNHDSHSPNTVKDLKELLQGQKIDYLFIDGDHSYKGVKKDFEMYAPLVKKGGLIGLHDIKDCEVYRKTGVEVHKFWKELKQKYNKTEEICVNSPQEYGGVSCGIGLITL